MHRQLRNLLLAFALVLPLSLVAGSSTAHAETRVGPTLGIQFNGNNFLLGADAWFRVHNINDKVSIHINPDFNYYFVGSHAWAISVNANVPFLFKLKRDIAAPYAFAGIGIRTVGVSVAGTSASSTGFAFNLGGGSMFMMDSWINPYVQMQFSFGTGGWGHAEELTAGVLFKF